MKLTTCLHHILKPLDEEYFGSTFPPSDEGFLVLMSISKGLSQNPMSCAASYKLLYSLGSIPLDQMIRELSIGRTKSSYLYPSSMSF